MRAPAALAASLALALVARGVGAQGTDRRLQPELRLDAIASRRTTGHVGAGLSMAPSTYVRAGAVLGAGYTGGPGRTGASARLDGVIRFLLDPLMQFRRAPYVGGGVSVRYEPRGDVRDTYLLIVAGYEGAPRRGVLPAVELGLGGGARVGVVLRRAVPGRR